MQILFLFLLILLNGAFAMSEIALVASRIEDTTHSDVQPHEADPSAADVARELLAEPDAVGPHDSQ